MSRQGLQALKVVFLVCGALCASLTPISVAGASPLRHDGVPPGVRRCAARSAAAPSLQVLLGNVRAALGQADGIERVRVGTPPRFYWGRSYPPTHQKITRHSAWVYITVGAGSGSGDASVVGQRAAWQAAVLVQALGAAICAAGQHPEAGYSIVTADGAPAFTANSGGALQSFPRSYGWPFARVGAAFRARLDDLARRYDFRVTSLVVLHGLGDAAQVRVESDHPALLIRHLAAVELALFSPTTNCWTSPSCFNGDWLEATDASGRPFVATGGLRTIGTGVGGWGSQWVRKGLPYPFPHG